MNKKTILILITIVITLLLTFIIISKQKEKENGKRIITTSTQNSIVLPTIEPIQTPEPTLTPIPEATPIGKYLGEFKITGYTASPSENGGYSVTALGDNLHHSIGWAIAVDPKVIPLKSKVYIEGIGYREARDTGGAIKGKKIDILTKSNKESYSITGYYKVYLIE